MEKCIERLKLYFHENGVACTIQEHRDAFTMQRVAAVTHESGSHVAKVVMAWADGKLMMLVVPAPERVDFERAEALLAARHVRRAREDEFQHLFKDCDLGAMPPFGNLYNLPVYLDRLLAEQAEMVFLAGTHHQSMKISTADYMRLVAPTVVNLTVEAHAHPA